MLREYYEMKEEIKNPETSVVFVIQEQWKPILSVVKNILQTKTLMFEKVSKID